LNNFSNLYNYKTVVDLIRTTHFAFSPNHHNGGELVDFPRAGRVVTVPIISREALVSSRALFLALLWLVET
jgi:hypothetical protein